MKEIYLININHGNAQQFNRHQQAPFADATKAYKYVLITN